MQHNFPETQAQGWLTPVKSGSLQDISSACALAVHNFIVSIINGNLRAPYSDVKMLQHCGVLGIEE